MMFFCFILLYETKSRALGQHIFTFFSCGYSETGGGQALTPLDTLFTIDIAEVQRFLALGARAAMRTAALQERRNRQILADIVRAYITTGEPVSSRAISKSFEETLSTATIRNVMADLEDGGFLYQPHTSAGRVPTAAAYRFFAQEIASRDRISTMGREWNERDVGGPGSATESNA